MYAPSETPSINVPDLSQPSTISRTCSDGPSYLPPTTVPSSVRSSFSKTGDINAVISGPHTPRTLVLCFDGTGDQFNSKGLQAQGALGSIATHFY
ncbi:hypothetical protein C8Q74DRAFT_1365159 [Fomes fomentarius]|nr:hypothetical protein C8Q74DRAFT_1365159 [Fomes fomentarius]